MDVDELKKGDVLICKTDDVPCLNYGHQYTVGEDENRELYVCCSFNGIGNDDHKHFLIKGMAEKHFRWKKEYYNG